LKQKPKVNGIDYVEVFTSDKANEQDSCIILVACFKEILDGRLNPLLEVDSTQIEIKGGTRIKAPDIRWVKRVDRAISQAQASADLLDVSELEYLKNLKRPSFCLAIRSTRGDFSQYTIQLLPIPNSPLVNFDPILSQDQFYFRIDCQSHLDCKTEAPVSIKSYKDPDIDYMARDYASFRQLLLDRLSLIIPDWRERNPADFGIAMVELMAYIGDHLSYYQDGVATEAYLSTARRRVSVKRHARLLDYFVHEGCNSRAWIHFRVAKGQTGATYVPAKTKLLTSGKIGPVVVKPEELNDALREEEGQVEVFETIENGIIFAANNELNFHQFGNIECCLAPGTTSATISNEGNKMYIELFAWDDLQTLDSVEEQNLPRNFLNFLQGRAGISGTGKIEIRRSSDGNTITMVTSRGQELFFTQEDWMSIVVGSGPQAILDGRRVTITLPGNSSQTGANAFFGAAYQSTWLLRGDFDVQVDYELLDWPPDNGVRIAVASNSGVFIGDATERLSDSAFGGESYFAHYAIQHFVTVGSTGTSEKSGSLRMERVGNILRGYYKSSEGNWVQFHSGPPNVFADTHIALQAWSHDDRFGDQDVRIVFDNFVINKGTKIIGEQHMRVEEPSLGLEGQAGRGENDKITLRISDSKRFSLYIKEISGRRAVCALTLQAGDVLLLEEAFSVSEFKDLLSGKNEHPKTVGRVAKKKKHFVRLTDVRRGIDNLTDTPLVQITWDSKDALPFPLCLMQSQREDKILRSSIARGNILLADHGNTIKNKFIQDSISGFLNLGPVGSEDLFNEQEPDEIDVGKNTPSKVIASQYLGKVPFGTTFRPKLTEGPLTFATTYDPSVPASSMLLSDPKSAIAAVRLYGEGQEWHAVRDLFYSNRFAPEFVIEIENDRSSYLRFGNQETLAGRVPTESTENPERPNHFFASYRIGNGKMGNVGAGAINRIIWNGNEIEKVYNPEQAIGGQEPEDLEEVKLYAPSSFLKQERAITEDDYSTILKRYPDVQRAKATIRWAGSWYTVFVAIDRSGGREVDNDFKAEIVQFLDKYRVTGYDLEILEPVYVPLNVKIRVRVKSGYSGTDILYALREAFGRKELPDGRLGFFHPDNFTFGTPVFASRIYERASEIEGVESVYVETFERKDRPEIQEFEEGVIKISEFGIARLDNDPNQPDRGLLEFKLEGEM